VPNEELERARDALRQAGFDLALLAAPSNICYVCGFEVPLPIDAGWEFAEGQPLVLLSTRESRAILLCPDLWMRLAARGNRLHDVRAYATVSFEYQVDALGAFLGALRTALRDAGAATGGVLGIEPRYLPQRVADLLGREFPTLALRDATAAMNEARLVKTDREIELIRRAVAAADAGQEELRRRCAEAEDAAGCSEIDVYVGVHAAVHRAAGGPVSIVGELVTGPRTGVVRYPGGPIDRLLERGDSVIQDISVRFAGYWSDCTNTLVVGAEPSAEQRRYFRAARRAFEATVEALRPGALTGEAVAAARRVFLSEGFDFTPYCGHQIGAAVNELPRLMIYDRTPVQAGMVFAVEPGVYGGEELGVGARAERVVVVRESGNEILSAFTWGMDA
jgi:Xaa-Pro dipeptidase